MKDYFSGHASDYARYRPTYPDELFDYLYEQVPNYDAAWDCATGNGQIAVRLAERFTRVYATDLSTNQLAQAPQQSNITYRVATAEEVSFGHQRFNIITVGQAIHWFEFDRFYEVVNKTLHKDGLLAVVGYGKHTISPEIDAVVNRLYRDILREYWDYERRYIEENYRTIPFPFEEISAPAFEQSLRWSYPDFVGYLNTWSAVKHYVRQNATNPIDLIEAELKQAWGDEKRTVRFPIILRVGRKQ